MVEKDYRKIKVTEYHKRAEDNKKVVIMLIMNDTRMFLKYEQDFITNQLIFRMKILFQDFTYNRIIYHVCMDFYYEC